MKPCILLAFLVVALPLPVQAAALRVLLSDTGPGDPTTSDDETAPILYGPGGEYPWQEVVPLDPISLDAPRHLYVWAEMIGGGTQKWSTIGLNIRTEGIAQIDSFEFWNYRNGGGFQRWDATSNGSALGGDTPTLVDDVRLTADAVGAGINSATNTVANQGPDFQYYNGGSTVRFTVFGRLTFSPTGAGVGAVYLGIGSAGIARDTGAVEEVYFGRDEADFLLGNSVNQYTPLPERRFVSTIPEPSGVVLLAVVGLLLARR